jgi:flagellar protein FlbD
MIQLHRLNGEAFYLNSDLIEIVESNPDTVVRLLNGPRYVIQESQDFVLDAIKTFRRETFYTCIPVNIPHDPEEA